jgi:hypothetical protein
MRTPGAREEGQGTMTVGLTVELPAAPAQRCDVVTLLDELRARVRSAPRVREGWSS